MAYAASSLFTDVLSGQASSSLAQWADVPQTAPSLGHSVPLSTATEWHTSDASLPSPSWLSLQYPSSPESPSASATPPPSSSRASSPSTSSPGSPRPKRKSVSRRSAKDPSHIPRPRNAFIIFRSKKCKEIRETNVEHDHRKISEIIGAMWRSASREVKEYYQELARREKEEHMRLFPGYRYSPQPRAVPPKKRKVKRQGEAERRRCNLIAQVLEREEGKFALPDVIQKFDRENQLQRSSRAAQEAGDVYTTAVFDSNPWREPSTPPPSESSPSPASTCSETPFRSPLLPPAPSPSSQETQVAIQELSDALTPLQLGPGAANDQYHGSVTPPTHLPNHEAIDNTVFSQTDDFAYSETSFGALPVEEDSGVLGISNIYPPQIPQFNAAPPLNPSIFQDETLFSADPSYAVATGIQFDPLLGYATGYTGDFGVSAAYSNTQEDLYPMWSSSQANGLEGPVQVQPGHMGGYMPSF